MSTKRIERAATVIGIAVSIFIVNLIGAGTLVCVSALRNTPFELFGSPYLLSDVVTYTLTGVATLAVLGVPTTLIIIGLSAKK